MSVEEVDEYIRSFDEPVRSSLERLRRTILDVIPDAEQGLSYAVPAFRIGGKVVAGFSAAAHHISYLPHSGEVLAQFTDEELGGLDRSKGALKLPHDREPDRALIAALVAARRQEAGV